MAQVKVIMLIPLADNDGRDLSVERDHFEISLYSTFFAWTRLGVVQGAYKMADGAKSLDEHMAYALFIDESRLDEVRQLLREFQNRTTQEAMYMEVQYNVVMELVTKEIKP